MDCVLILPLFSIHVMHEITWNYVNTFNLCVNEAALAVRHSYPLTTSASRINVKHKDLTLEDWVAPLKALNKINYCTYSLHRGTYGPRLCYSIWTVTYASNTLWGEVKQDVSGLC